MGTRYRGKGFQRTKIFDPTLEMQLIRETLKLRIFNIVKALKILGLGCYGCFKQFTLKTVDAKEGSHCNTLQDKTI